MSLPEDVDPAQVPQGWVRRDGRRLVYIARELIVAFPADSPPMTVDQPNIGVGVAVVTDPSLVQDLEMDPAKVAYVGGFSGDLTSAVTPLAARPAPPLIRSGPTAHSPTPTPRPAIHGESVAAGLVRPGSRCKFRCCRRS